MSKRILVVDDDVDYQVQLRTRLEGAGFEVESAEGIEAAHEACAARKPDLAIVDLMLDHLDDGFTLCYQLKKRDAALPIIMVSNVAKETGLDFDAATDEERSWIKADAFLHKPVRFETLEREIHRLMPV